MTDWNRIRDRGDALIAGLALLAIGTSLLLRWLAAGQTMIAGLRADELPLATALVTGGVPLVAGLVHDVVRGRSASDVLAGMSIVTALLLGEFLAGTIVVLMLSGGRTLEGFAVTQASSVLEALARRMPTKAHRKTAAGPVEVPIDGIEPGDLVLVFPHEVCPADGVVSEGRGSMDEAYLTGEPYVISKAPGSAVLGGAINGAATLTIRVTRLAADSRYAKIMAVMEAAEQKRPRLRRLADELGAYYAPLAIAIAAAAWLASGSATRFLAVLVIATPCPLLIAIPVAIIGSISLAARLGIIIRDPAALEKLNTCRTIIFDKTGTLSYGKPELTEIHLAPGFDEHTVLSLVASLEQYSKHPLAAAIVEAAGQAGLARLEATESSEQPGAGLQGIVAGRRIAVTSPKKLIASDPGLAGQVTTAADGMECAALIDGRYAATFHFRDRPRREGASFVRHLAPRHHFERALLVSGDREPEVRYVAEQVGISQVYSCQSPEEKLEIVQAETRRANTVFLGDGINDAPALSAATVGIAFGNNSDITSEAADAVILDPTLEKVDTLLHIGARLRAIALESALGGMGLSVAGMLLAALGYLPPVVGAVVQECIDVIAVVNALRVAIPPRSLSDFAGPLDET